LDFGELPMYCLLWLARSEDPATHEKDTSDVFERVIAISRNTYLVLFILVLIGVVVSIDILFFKNRFWERLIVNIGIVLVFIAFYLRFLKKT
jgi:hypothetical protein